jgi:hypothetical protein
MKEGGRVTSTNFYLGMPDLAVETGSRRATAHEVIHERIKKRWYAPEEPACIPKNILVNPWVQWFLSRTTSLRFTVVLQLLIYIAFLILLMYGFLLAFRSPSLLPFLLPLFSLLPFLSVLSSLFSVSPIPSPFPILNSPFSLLPSPFSILPFPISAPSLPPLSTHPSTNKTGCPSCRYKWTAIFFSECLLIIKLYKELEGEPETEAISVCSIFFFIFGFRNPFFSEFWFRRIFYFVYLCSQVKLIVSILFGNGLLTIYRKIFTRVCFFITAFFFDSFHCQLPLLLLTLPLRPTFVPPHSSRTPRPSFVPLHPYRPPHPRTSLNFN